jgi:hypothetical protein
MPLGNGVAMRGKSFPGVPKATLLQIIADWHHILPEGLAAKEADPARDLLQKIQDNSIKFREEG